MCVLFLTTIAVVAVVVKVSLYTRTFHKMIAIIHRSHD